MSPEPMPGWQPDHEIEVIAGTPPGGGQDRAARALAAALAEILDVPVVVTNVSGRGGANAWDELTSRAPDGHHLSISSPTLVTNLLVGVSDLEPESVTHLALLCTEYIAFAVPADSSIADATSLLDLLAARRALVVAFATELGNVNHMALADVTSHTGSDPAELRVKVFESARHAVADTLAGGSDAAVVTAASVVPEVGTGSARVLATSAPERLTAPLDSVPTWAEIGVDCTMGTWRGLIGPPDFTPDQIAFWDTAVGAAVASGQWRDALARHLWSDTYMAAAAALTFVAGERARMSGSLRALGLMG